MTPEARDLAAAFLAECWRPVPEVSRHYRDEKRKADRAQQRQLEEWALTAVNNSSTTTPDLPTEVSTGCAQNGSENVPVECDARSPSVRKSSRRPNKSTPGRGASDTNAPRGLAS